MSRLRLAAALALVSGALVASPSSYAAAPLTLAGTTVIRATRAASVDVRLARPVTVATPFGSSPDLAVTATGRLAAFVLRGTSATTRSVTLVGGMAGPAGDRFLMPIPQFPAFGGGTFEEIKTFGDTTKLPAGGYRLYVVPDGTAQWTLRLRGVSGRTTITPGRKAAGEVVRGDAYPAATPASGNAFLGGVTRTLPGQGFVLHALHADVQAAAAWQLVMCHNNADDAQADELRTMPGCPNAEKHTLVNHRAPEADADDKFFVQGFAGVPAGSHGLSAAYTSQGYVTALDYTTLWLTY
jgi:hypothetical protein